MRLVLIKWLEDSFDSAQHPSQVWPTSTTVIQFLRAKTAEVMSASLARAAMMLQGKWRLPDRVRKNSRVVADAGPMRSVAARCKTPAYRFLHHGVSHFYQRIGITAVAKLSAHMHL
eukprot:TRINITY_DN7096_c0_g1_i1.p4 TRINITY_DN7096_c0_g1~~TRINITY_DN7096_c0_g1_i1.p4  ORF type:complete len:116 (+),score=15.42 TRINITY_DN7096_c0_g1_i1:1858-2205(+)